MAEISCENMECAFVSESRKDNLDGCILLLTEARGTRRTRNGHDRAKNKQEREWNW